MSAGDRLYAVYRVLLASVTDDGGLGGPVAHTATVDGWNLRLATSDLGDLAVTATDGDRFIGFEAGQLPGEWAPFTTHTNDYMLAWLADLAERADWLDTLPRRRGAA